MIDASPIFRREVCIVRETLLEWSGGSSEPNVGNRLLLTVSLGCGHAKGIDRCMATIHAAFLEYADMSSGSSWAASVGSSTWDEGTEIGICDCRVSFLGSLDSMLVRVIQSVASSSD